MCVVHLHMYYTQLTCSVQPVNRSCQEEKVRLKKMFWSIFNQVLFSDVLISRCFGTHITSSFCFTASLLFTVLGTFSKNAMSHKFRIVTIIFLVPCRSLVRAQTNTDVHDYEECRDLSEQWNRDPNCPNPEFAGNGARVSCADLF